MEVSATDFSKTVRKYTNGDEADATMIVDYVEQTKQTNISKLKDVFLTKDDKVELIIEIHSVRSQIDTNFKWSAGMFVFVLITLFVLVFKSFS